MDRNTLTLRTLGAAVVLAGAGCRDASSPPMTPTAPTAAASRAGTAQGAQAPDLATLARTIPGFGGFYLDAGVPTVYLLDPAARGATERALGGYAAARGFTPAQVRVLQGRYDYRDLDRWFQRISYAAFSTPGVVYTDLDEAVITRRFEQVLGVSAEARIVHSLDEGTGEAEIDRKLAGAASDQRGDGLAVIPHCRIATSCARSASTR